MTEKQTLNHADVSKQPESGYILDGLGGIDRGRRYSCGCTRYYKFSSADLVRHRRDPPHVCRLSYHRIERSCPKTGASSTAAQTGRQILRRQGNICVTGESKSVMATTDLKLDEPGTLPRPGPLGRFVRLGFGLMCTWYVVGLFAVNDNLMVEQGHIRPLVWNGVFAGMVLISYVINIGFSRAWKKWPAIACGVVFLLIAANGYLLGGTIETEMLARAIWLWEVYLFSHLGAAFVIAALIGTPGCEMRAFHDLYSRLSGKATAEHHCPIGPLQSIDQWEAGHHGR